jgi:hypothetical protein
VSLTSKNFAASTTVGQTELDRDFSEFIASCAAHDVRFLIVGGYAVAAHGHPRFTKDLDVWVLVDEENAERLLLALDDFGFGSVGLVPADFLGGRRRCSAWPPTEADRHPDRS